MRRAGTALGAVPCGGTSGVCGPEGGNLCFYCCEPGVCVSGTKHRHLCRRPETRMRLKRSQEKRFPGRDSAALCLNSTAWEYRCFEYLGGIIAQCQVITDVKL